jgi:hypothetical protein
MTIKLPAKKIDIINEKGEKVGEKNIVLHLILLVISNTPQRSDTDTLTAFALREKLGGCSADAESLELSDAEAGFIRTGIEKLRSSERMMGADWGYLIKAMTT